MVKNNIPKNPFSFGLFSTKPHLKWATIALSFVLLATALDRFSVIVLKNLTDSIARSQIDFNSVWFWAIIYPTLYLCAGTSWRISGFTGMRWFMNLRSFAYQQLYQYITLHSKDYFNSRF